MTAEADILQGIQEEGEEEKGFAFSPVHFYFLPYCLP